MRRPAQKKSRRSRLNATGGRAPKFEPQRRRKTRNAGAKIDATEGNAPMVRPVNPDHVNAPDWNIPIETPVKGVGAAIHLTAKKRGNVPCSHDRAGLHGDRGCGPTVPPTLAEIRCPRVPGRSTADTSPRLSSRRRSDDRLQGIPSCCANSLRCSLQPLFLGPRRRPTELRPMGSAVAVWTTAFT